MVEKNVIPSHSLTPETVAGKGWVYIMYHILNLCIAMEKNRFIEVADGVFIEKDDMGGAELDCLFEELSKEGITPRITLGMEATETDCYRDRI